MQTGRGMGNGQYGGDRDRSCGVPRAGAGRGDHVLAGKVGRDAAVVRRPQHATGIAATTDIDAALRSATRWPTWPPATSSRRGGRRHRALPAGRTHVVTPSLYSLYDPARRRRNADRLAAPPRRAGPRCSSAASTRLGQRRARGYRRRLCTRIDPSLPGDLRYSTPTSRRGAGVVWFAVRWMRCR